MPTFEAHDREALIDKVSADPLRRRTGFQAHANEFIPPSVKNSRHGLRVTEHLPLPQDVASLANDAYGYRIQRNIKSCIKAYCRSPLARSAQSITQTPQSGKWAGIQRAEPNTPSLP
jgi:hypothetical protein